jgi:hypothetical protein
MAGRGEHPLNTDDLQLLADEREIRAVLARYCRGVDRCDEELIRSCYHPDSTDNHGTYNDSGIGFGAWVVKALREGSAATLHTLGQSIIDIDKDKAYCETHVLAYHRSERDGKTILDTFGGRYVDRMEKRNGEWKLADRVVVRDWDKREQVEPMFPAGIFEEGKRSREDLAFNRS